MTSLPNNREHAAQRPGSDRADASGAKPKLPGAPDERFPRMLTPKYRLDSLIAVGGMGRVYAGTQLPLQRKVAIKLLTAQKGGDDFRRRFLLEASVSGRLTHRNIVTVHDYGETPAGEVFMVMELLDGEPLTNILARETRLAPERACRIAIEICRALRVAHKQSVAHRDLKPGNVMILRGEEEGDAERVKVLDFGLVKVFQDAQEAPLDRDLTQGETMLGSPRYMAPEQIMCEPADNRTDIYSLGVVLFSMLTGELPFAGKSAVQVLKQHLQAPVPTLAEKMVLRPGETAAPALPPALDEIVRRCMEKDPADRYASVDELSHALSSVYATLTGVREEGSVVFQVGPDASGPRGAVIPSLTPTPTPALDGLNFDEAPENEERRSRAWIGVLVAALVAAGAVGGGVALMEKTSPAEQPEPAPAVAATQVVLTSEPPGAEVRLGERLLGTTPTEQQLDPAELGERVELDFTLAGHHPAKVPATLRGDRIALHTELRPLPPPTVEVPAEEPAAPIRAAEEPEQRREPVRERRVRGRESRVSTREPEQVQERRPQVVDEARRRSVPVVD